MKTRQLLAVAAAIPLVAAVAPADAAAKRRPRPPAKVCNLIKDATADATGNGTGAMATPNDPNLDIVTADIVTDATRVTAVVRLTSVDGTGNNSPTGRAYAVSFLAHKKVITLRTLVSPTGNDYQETKGTGTVDAAKKEVRITVPISALGIPLKKGDKLTELKATTARWVGTLQASLGIVDTAVGAGSYVAGTPSCVTVGV